MMEFSFVMSLFIFFHLLKKIATSFQVNVFFLFHAEIKEEKEMIRSLFDVIKKLPKANFDLFERLCFHLAW